MFCKNCGVYNTDDSVFCTKCGANLKAESNNAEKVEQQAYTPEPVNIQPSYTPPQGNVNNYQMQPPEEPKKKKGKKKAVIGIIIALVAIVVIGIVALFSWTSVARASVGNVDFYLWREYKNIADLVDTGVFDNLSHTQTFDSDTDVKIGYDGDELVNGGIEMSYDKEKHSTTATVNIEADGEKIPVSINYCDGKISLASKELIGDSTVYLDVNDLSTLESNSSGNSGSIDSDIDDIDLSKTILDEDVRENIISALPGIVTRAEKDTLAKKAKTSIKFVNGKPCTVVTIDATEEDWAEFLDALWEGCKDNDDVMDVIESTAEIIGVYSGEEGSDYIDAIDYAIENSLKYADDDTSTIITIAYSLTGEIVQRTVTVSGDIYDGEGYMTLNTALSGKSKTMEMEMYDDGEKWWSFNYDISTKGDKLNGTISCKRNDGIYDYDYQFELEDIGVEKCNGVYVPVGKLTVNINDDFNLNVEADGSKDYSISVKGSADDSDFYGTVDSELSNKADLKDFEEPKKDSDSISVFDLFNGNYLFGSSYDPSYQDNYYDYSDSDYDYGNYDYNYGEYDGDGYDYYNNYDM